MGNYNNGLCGESIKSKTQNDNVFACDELFYGEQMGSLFMFYYLSDYLCVLKQALYTTSIYTRIEGGYLTWSYRKGFSFLVKFLS